MSKDETVEKITRMAVPEHLIEATTEELKAEVDSAVNEEKKEIDLDDPKLQEEYVFAFSWKDGRGKLWKGQFCNKILDVSEMQAVGVLRAKLSGGIDFGALDPLTSELNLMISHLTYSLTEKPEWAKDLRKLKDISLLQELYGEVASHEATFFGYKGFERNS